MIFIHIASVFPLGQAMGITGLLPFLNKSSRRGNISEFSGQTVAIDAYCWLHKGAFSCADKLVMDEPTVLYVSYCMKLINMLLSHNIKPILVFDGRYLPAKAEIEKKRRESRALNRQKGAELLRAGQVDQGRSYLRRSVDITHRMALNLIRECRNRNIDCIVAPYEADAQLAYLNIKNIAQVVITEDSDLLLFGCVKVFFKMDINGNGILIEKDKLHISMGIRHDSFSIDKFRYMCILSGCDYLPSLPGIGLCKARKFINRTSEQNIYEALLKLPVNLQMWTLPVTDEYRSAFVEADRTFKYQLVYDPLNRKQVPLNETENENEIVGNKLDEDVAFQLALGNLDPMTLEKMDCYDPDKQGAISASAKKNLFQRHSSIWSRNFIPRALKGVNKVIPVHNSTKGLSVVAKVSFPLKRPIEDNYVPDTQPSDKFLMEIYGGEKEEESKVNEADSDSRNNSCSAATPEKSPILFRKKNPFALQSSTSSASKRIKLENVVRLKLGLNSDESVRSRYFVEEEDTGKNILTDKSVLDIIDKQENCVEEEKEKKPEVESESENKESASCGPAEIGETLNELKDCPFGVQNSLFKYSFKSHENVTNDGKELQTESSRSPSASEKSENEKSLPSSPLRLISKENVVSMSANDVTFTKNFYRTEYSDDLHREEVSPYFNKHEGNDSDIKVSKSETPTKCNRNVSLMKSTKKSVKRVLSKCMKGKQQSLLTKFGFQSREMNELKIISEESDSPCVFCMSCEVNEFKFGPLYEREGLVAHYYCVLFSNKLLQNGDDYEGFLGFLIKDVKQELQRINKITCFYCSKTNASVSCWYKKCKRNFHFSCGYVNKALNQFKGFFKTFCFEHRPKQRIPQKFLTEAENNHPTCLICYDLVNPKCMSDAIWAPCCLKTWYHRECIQRQALSAGYFFKCAACNNNDRFKHWVEEHGIFVPNQDASWELEPNAFSELETVRYECDAEKCSCPYGRRYFTSLERKKHKKNRDRKWEILLCKICASQGTHLTCAGSKFANSKWTCDLCSKVYSENGYNGRANRSRRKSNPNVLKVDDSHVSRTEERFGDEGNASTSSFSCEESSHSKGPALGKRSKTGTKRKRKRADVEDCEKLAKKKAARSVDCDEGERSRSSGDSSEEVSPTLVSEADTSADPLKRPPEDIVNEACGTGKSQEPPVPAGTASEEVVELAEGDDEVVNVDLIDLTDCNDGDMTEEEKHSVVEVYRNFQLNDIKYRVKKEIRVASDGESDGSELEIILERNRRNELPKSKDANGRNGESVDTEEVDGILREEKAKGASGDGSHFAEPKKKEKIKDKLLKQYFSIVDQESSSCFGKEIENFMRESKRKKKASSKHNRTKRSRKSRRESDPEEVEVEVDVLDEMIDFPSRGARDSGDSPGSNEGVNDVEIVKIVGGRKKIGRSQQFSDVEEEIIDIE